MKKLVIFMMCLNFMFGVELDFKDTTLDEFKIYGMGEEIVFKDKKERDDKIAKVWEKFLSSQAFSNAQDANKIVVVYSDYKKDSFNCFIGIRSKSVVSGLSPKVIEKSTFNKAVLSYNSSIKMNDLWDEINEKKLKRSFKVDMEEYNINDLAKKAYNINIYLSK